MKTDLAAGLERKAKTRPEGFACRKEFELVEVRADKTAHSSETGRSYLSSSVFIGGSLSFSPLELPL
jgi:hypothetical protein